MNKKRSFILILTALALSTVIIFLSAYYILFHIDSNHERMRSLILCGLPFVISSFCLVKFLLGNIEKHSPRRAKKAKTILYIVTAIFGLLLTIFFIFPPTNFGYANNIYGVLFYELFGPIP